MKRGEWYFLRWLWGANRIIGIKCWVHCQCNLSSLVWRRNMLTLSGISWGLQRGCYYIIDGKWVTPLPWCSYSMQHSIHEILSRLCPSEVRGSHYQICISSSDRPLVKEVTCGVFGDNDEIVGERRRWPIEILKLELNHLITHIPHLMISDSSLMCLWLGQ